MHSLIAHGTEVADGSGKEDWLVATNIVSVSVDMEAACLSPFPPCVRGRMVTARRMKETVSWRRRASGVRSANPREFTGQFARVDPNDIRFSQTTAGGRGRAAQLRESMKDGWNGPAVDAIETPRGLVTIDNTRIAVARELRIGEVPVKVRLPSDPLPSSMLGRFGNSRTWGEALQFRTGRQRPPLPTNGTLDPPRMP